MGKQRIVEMGPACPKILGLQSEMLRQSTDKKRPGATEALQRSGTISFKNSCLGQTAARH